tara:strand:+ start:5342 stop:6265 length:924 start_codon:yes stop_codon:yes gene_type:complete
MCSGRAFSLPSALIPSDSRNLRQGTTVDEMAPPRGTCGTVYAECPESVEGLKLCPRTRRLVSIRCFEMNPKAGKAKVYCVECEKKTKKQTKAYRATEHGKSKTKERNGTENTKASKAAYRNGSIGKAKAKTYASSEKFLEKCRQYAKTPAAKQHRKQHYDENKLSTSLMNAFARVVRGGNSPIAVLNSSFESELHIREHIANQLENTPYSYEDFGDGSTNWSIDHAIPRCAYNHDDSEDVRRCWSPSNVRVMNTKANKEKWNAIVEQVVLSVSADCWPKAWGGVLPKDGSKQVQRTASPATQKPNGR